MGAESCAAAGAYRQHGAAVGVVGDCGAITQRQNTRNGQLQMVMGERSLMCEFDPTARSNQGQSGPAHQAQPRCKEPRASCPVRELEAHCRSRETRRVAPSAGGQPPAQEAKYD